MKKIIPIDFNQKARIKSNIEEKGYTRLDAEGIKSHIIGKTFLGSFPPSFKYIISVNADGTLEGKNNYQHYDIGKWTIDTENNTLSVNWDYGWISSTNYVCLTNDVIKMFDSTSGKLNTSFDKQIQHIENIKAFNI